MASPTDHLSCHLTRPSSPCRCVADGFPNWLCDLLVVSHASLDEALQLARRLRGELLQQAVKGGAIQPSPDPGSRVDPTHA